MTMHRSVRFVPLDPDAFEERTILAATDEPELTLGELLRDLPAFSLEPLDPQALDLLVGRLTVYVEQRVALGTPLYLPPGIDLTGLTTAGPNGGPVDGSIDGSAGSARYDGDDGEAREAAAPSSPASLGDPASLPVVAAGPDHPEELYDKTAVLVAHDVEINRAADYLASGLSVLVRCEKLLVEYLADEIAGRSGRTRRVVRVAATPSAAGPGDPTALGGGRRAELLAALQAAVADAKSGDVVVVPHLDLLAGGSDAALSSEARELTDVLYEQSGCLLLAFTDPSLMIPEVLANRFAVRMAIEILPREVVASNGERVPIGRALVTRAEAELFAGYDAAGLYKHVAGMNAVRLRHALRFAYHQYQPTNQARRPSRSAPAQKPRPEPRPKPAPTFAALLHELRVFKARTSTSFEVPDTKFDAIGGYDDVKAELIRAIDIVGGAAELPEHLRLDLVPRGFIFHGPPGTGKTLFAKAVAARLEATILVVSGPEVTDMYVGESERKVRELFAEARRNAPAVVVFDEFDSIAGRRSGREDGGSRAGNAIVAQLLTELDGFRSEVPVLIIGTTNRIDLIDDALLRPSRFRPIKIDLPGERARRAIARVHADHFGVPVSERLLERIARATEGMNGDEIRSLFRDSRADELVGEPRRPADARRLGELVGRLRRARQQRDLDRGEQPGGRAATAAPHRADAATRRASTMHTISGRPSDQSRPSDQVGPAAAPPGQIAAAGGSRQPDRPQEEQTAS